MTEATPTQPKRDNEPLHEDAPFTDDGGTLRKNQDSQPSIHVDENGEIRRADDPTGREFDAGDKDEDNVTRTPNGSAGVE